MPRARPPLRPTGPTATCKPPIAPSGAFLMLGYKQENDREAGPRRGSRSRPPGFTAFLPSISINAYGSKKKARNLLLKVASRSPRKAPLDPPRVVGPQKEGRGLLERRTEALESDLGWATHFYAFPAFSTSPILHTIQSPPGYRRLTYLATGKSQRM